MTTFCLENYPEFFLDAIRKAGIEPDKIVLGLIPGQESSRKNGCVELWTIQFEPELYLISVCDDSDEVAFFSDNNDLERFFDGGGNIDWQEVDPSYDHDRLFSTK